MEFKRTVAGISAAAIAVTQVAAVVPMSAFAATEQPVEEKYGFALKLGSNLPNSTKPDGQYDNYDAAYGNLEAKTAVFNAESIVNAADTNTALNFSYAGTISEEDVKVGDKYTFTIKGLEIVANGKDVVTPGSATTVNNTETNLDPVTTPDSVTIASEAAVGDVVTITYTPGDGAAELKAVCSSDDSVIELSTSNGANSQKIATFTVEDAKQSTFTLSGNGNTIDSVVVTHIKKVEEFDALDDVANEGFNPVLAGSGVQTVTVDGSVGDEVVITFEATEPAPETTSPVTVTDTAEPSNPLPDTDGIDNSTYTFKLTENSTTGFKVDGNGYTITAITHKKVVTNDKTPATDDEKQIKDVTTEAGTIEVANTSFENAAVGNKIRVTYTANSGAAGSVVIKSVEDTIETLTTEAGEGEQVVSTDALTADTIKKIQKDGITIKGSGVTVKKVELVVPEKTTDGTATTLLETTDTSWTQVNMGGWWSGDQDIAETAIADKIGTVEAFKTNFDNITATWTELTVTKTVLDKGVIWEGETDLGNWGKWITVGATDVKAGGKLIVDYKNASSGQIMFQTASYKEFEGKLASAKSTTGATGSLAFELDDAAAKEISANGFVVGGAGAVVTSIKYEAAPEASTKITDITKDTNFQNVLKLYDANGDKALTAAEIAAITELGTEKKDEKFKNEASLLAKVKNFAGIEKLTALTTLVVKDSTNVTALDLSANTALVSLDLTGCTKLADLKLPEVETVTKLALSGTAITKLDTTLYNALTYLDVSGTKLTEVGVGENVNLETLIASNCGLKSINVSANTALKSLDVSNNNLVALDLSGLTALTELKAENNARKFGKVLDGVYDLSKLEEFGLAAENMTIMTDGVEKGEGLTLNGVTGNVVYDYATGYEGEAEGLDKVTFTLTPENITAVNYVLKYNDGKEDKAVDFEKWDDVLKAINNKDIAYTIELKKDVNVDKLAFPAAAKAKSVTIDGAKTITTKSTSVALPTDVTLKDVTIKAVDKDGKTAAKSLTLTASKNLTIDHLNLDATATTIKGGAKSVLNVADETIVNSIVSGFGTLKLDAEASATFNKNVTVKELIINNAGVLVGENAVLKFTNINCSNGGGIMYTSEKFIPVAVTNITGEGKLQILISYEKAVTVEEVTQTTTVEEFTAGNVVLNSKTVDLSKIDASLTEGTTLGKSGKSGNEVTVMATVMDVNGVKYGQWSDVLSTIAAKAKADKNAAASIDYVVTLFNGLDAKGALKMPAAKTYKSLTFKSADEAETQTITFKGNLSLTGNTTFEKVKLVSDKDFSISAAKNELTLKNVTAEKKIKSISSSGVVNLEKVTVSAVSAATVNVTTPAVVSEPGGGNAIGSVNAWVENKAVADKSSVFVDGNLTAKTALNLNGTASSLTVNGVLNAAEIKAEKSDAVLVVKQPAKGNALVIGKNGFNGTSKQIKFVLADADGNAAKITDVVTLGTIAGTYADDLLPSNDNLVKDDTYYIVKEGKNLKAVPKTSVTATDEITVTINGKPARYKNIDEAIKDISASGKATDNVAIMITANTFKDTIAKLPLPTAGKYKTLTYEAASPVTIKVSSDLALTGNLNIDSDITINKVGKDGKTTAISVNVGKYQFATLGLLSATTDEAPKGQIANISGNGLFTTDENVIVTGKVNGTTLVLRGNTVKLEGDKASFAGGIHTTANSTLAYTNAKNVKFTSVKGERNTSLTLTTTATENAIIAAITGDYTKDAVKISGSELKVVRSGNNLKAVKAENVVEVETEEGKPTTRGTRTYDTLANAMNDISRIKDGTARYIVYVKNGDELVLPKAKTYSALGITTRAEKAEIKTLKDLALTGTLMLSDKVTLNKVKGDQVQPISVNVGNYLLYVQGYLSPKDGVSQIVNISGKGRFYSDNAVNVTGKVNVGWYMAISTTLGAKSSFAASTIVANSDFTFNYPMSIAKNVKFGSFYGDGLKLNIDGIKEGQIATIAGGIVDGCVVIGDGKTFKAVRSGNKLMAVKADAEVVTVYEQDTKLVYDTYANAVADINRINYKDGQYTVTLTGDMTASKLALPAKGKYKSIRFVADKAVTITVNGDIALTGDLIIGENVTLKKSGDKALKFTSPKDKNKKPLYKVSTQLNGKIVKPAGETVEEIDKAYNLDWSSETGIDLSESNIKFVKTNVEEGGKIVVTFKEEVTGRVKIANGIHDLAEADVNGATTVLTLDSRAAEEMTEGDFSIVGVDDFAGIVTSVKYVAPVKYTLGQDLTDGVTLTAEGMIFKKASNVEKTGVITVEFGEDISAATITLNEKNGTLIATAAKSEKIATFTLTATQAAKLAANEFVLKGTGKVKSVKYIAPAKKNLGTFDTAIDLTADGTIFFNKAEVAENGTITVTFDVYYTGDVTLVKTGADANIVAKTVDSATTAVFTLNTEEAAEITENGFILKVNAAAKVASVTYAAPAPVVTKYDVDVALPESGVAIGENGLTFNKKAVAENGKIVVTFKENVTGTFNLVKASTEEIATATLDTAANKVEFTLDSTKAAEITNNGFILKGLTTAVVASVTYVAPEVGGADEGLDA